MKKRSILLSLIAVAVCIITDTTGGAKPSGMTNEQKIHIAQM